VETIDTPARALNQEWIDRQQRYRSQELPLAMSLVGQYFGADSEGYFDEPFALLHHNEVRNDAPAKKKPRRPGRHPDVPDGDR
jgi:hypothetical protein